MHTNTITSQEELSFNVSCTHIQPTSAHSNLQSALLALLSPSDKKIIEGGTDLVKELFWTEIEGMVKDLLKEKVKEYIQWGIIEAKPSQMKNISTDHCSECQNLISGNKYLSMHKPNYTLCQNCEDKGYFHPSPMIRIDRSLQDYQENRLHRFIPVIDRVIRGEIEVRESEMENKGNTGAKSTVANTPRRERLVMEDSQCESQCPEDPDNTVDLQGNPLMLSLIAHTEDDLETIEDHSILTLFKI